jgi:SOS-response transcriptional repressor LexA
MQITHTRRESLLNVIKAYINQHGFSPTVKELQELTIDLNPPKGFSFGSIQWHLGKLEEEGYITRQKGLGRTIRLK